MRTATALVLLAALAACASAIPLACNVPGQWEGRFSTWDHGKGTHDEGFISYDNVGERVRFVDEVNAGTPGKKYYEALELHKEHKLYKVDMATRNCTVEDIPESRSWRAWGIPENATFRGAYTLGVFGEDLAANEWTLPVGQHAKNWLWVGSFTSKDCAPIREIVVQQITNAITTEYFDLTLGLHDPNIFEVPEECRGL